MVRFARTAALLLAMTLIGAAPANAAVVTCGQVITTNTTVENDLSCPDQEPGESAVRIGAAGITLNLNGHLISGHSIGISNDGYADVTIRNGRVAGTARAMVLTGVSGNTIAHLQFAGITDGLRVSGGDHNRIASNVFQGVTAGVDSDDTTVAHNEMQGFEGILAVSGSYNRVVDNTTNSSGIRADGDHAYIARNDVRVDFLTFNLTGLDDSRVVDNVIVGIGNTFHTPVLLLSGSSNNLLRGNALFRGTFYLQSGSDNLLRKNVVWGAEPPVAPEWQGLTGDGFLIEGTGTTLVNNLAVNNTDDGIDVRAPGTVVTRNTANDNGGLGIRAVSGVVDGGGNKASGNDNPFQCLNVACG